MRAIQPSQTTTQPRWIFFLVPGAFLLLCALFNIVALASVSPVGSEIHALEMKTRALAKQNRNFELEIAKTQSLVSLKEQAVLEGYIPIGKLTVVDPASTSLALQTH